MSNAIIISIFALLFFVAWLGFVASLGVQLGLSTDTSYKVAITPFVLFGLYILYFN